MSNCFLRAVIVGTIAVLGSSCSSEPVFFDSDYGANNTTDLAVSGGLEELSYTSAVIKGYVNIGVLVLSGVDIGVMVSEDSNPTVENSKSFTTSSLEEGRAFTVTANKLSPGKKYYYRTFITSALDPDLNMLGKVLFFTTETPSSDITKPVNADKVSYSGGLLSGSLLMDELSENDCYSVGVYIRINGEDVYYEDSYFVNKDGSFSVNVAGVCSAGNTYQWGTYIKMGDEKYMSKEEKSLSTKNAASLLKIDAPYQISYSSAMFSVTVGEEVLSSDWWHVSVFCIQDYTPGTSPYDYDSSPGNGYCAYCPTSNYNPGLVSVNGRKVTFREEGLGIGEKFDLVVALSFEKGDDRADILLTGQSFSTIEYNSSELIDLGLSVKWRNCNLGASSPEMGGDFFAWGETEPRNALQSVQDYKWYDKQNGWLKYNGSDGKRHLDLSDDAARCILGSTWRIPTLSEFEELVSHCTWSRAFYKGQRGVIGVASNGNAVFFPSTGYISTSTLKNSDYCFLWTSNSIDERLACSYSYIAKWSYGVDYRYSVLLTIRPVK